jgi:hypothetical protein
MDFDPYVMQPPKRQCGAHVRLLFSLQLANKSRTFQVESCFEENDLKHVKKAFPMGEATHVDVLQCKIGSIGRAKDGQFRH